MTLTPAAPRDVTRTPSAATSARPRLAWWALLPVAAAAGFALSAAFAPVGGWGWSIAGVALVATVVLLSRRAVTTACLVAFAGLVLNAMALTWEAQISVDSYVGLVAVEALYFAALGAGLHAVRRWTWAPVASAALWTAVEFVQARWPFGGFAWTRLGYGVLDSPFAGYYPFIGAGATGFLVALLGHVLVWGVGRRPRRALTALLTAATVLALGAAGTLYRPDPDPARGSVPVGYVQGGAPGGGVYGLGAPRTLTRNHVRETANLMTRVAAGQLPRPAFVVWPENSTDMDPFADAETNRLVVGSIRATGVPVMVGSPVAGPGRDERQTAALWWTPDRGVRARYDKRNLVPFGEWIPFRSLLLPLVPLLAYVGEQSIPGTAPGALDTGLGFEAGVAICFEVAYPDTMYQAVDAGAETMIVQSSNAMFQGTPQIEQQFAISRVRAAEMRREVLVVTTSGISGLIGPDGGVVERLPEDGAASDVVTLGRSTLRTPVMLGGRFAEHAIALLAAACLVVGLVRRRAWRRGTQWPDTTQRQGERTHG